MVKPLSTAQQKKLKENIPNKAYECFPNNLNNEINMFTGQVTGNAINKRIFLNLPPFPVINLTICLIGNNKSHTRFIIFTRKT